MIRNKLIFVLVTIFSVWKFYSQNAIVVAGGSTKGEGGSLSYTIGQMFYKNYHDNNQGRVSEGVQQPNNVTFTLKNMNVMQKLDKLYVYPNPTMDFLNIKSDSDYTSYEIYDLNGKLIKSSKLFNCRIDLKSLLSGVYIIYLKNTNKWYYSRVKVIKQ
ncbi:T9SS type A sorting domain-containing protein [Riemerella anatipestifer]|nr:T9SS type A sorting domain-containing protein [Riemerella anatipestifer]